MHYEIRINTKYRQGRGSAYILSNINTNTKAILQFEECSFDSIGVIQAHKLKTLERTMENKKKRKLMKM